LSILLCFSKLRDDGYSQKLLASQLNRKRDRFFLFEFNVADTDKALAIRSKSGWVASYPLDRPLTLSFTI
jgi:hypothetical protein